jgi:hypothetical protein
MHMSALASMYLSVPAIFCNFGTYPGFVGDHRRKVCLVVYHSHALYHLLQFKAASTASDCYYNIIIGDVC